MTLLIAGHTFENDVCVTHIQNADGDMVPCSRKFVDIMHVDMSCMNQPGYAHYGTLNENEIKSIMAEVALRKVRFTSATAEGAGYGNQSPTQEKPADTDELSPDWGGCG